MSFTFTIGQWQASNLQNTVIRLLKKKKPSQNFEIIMYDDTFVVTTENGTIVLNVEVKYGSAYIVSEMILAACKEWQKLNP